MSHHARLFVKVILVCGLSMVQEVPLAPTDEKAPTEAPESAPIPPWNWRTVSRFGITVCTPDPIYLAGVDEWVPTLTLADDRSIGIQDRGGPKPVLEASLDGRKWLQVPCELRGGLWVARHRFRAWSAILPALESSGRAYLVWFRLRGSTKAAPVLVRT